MESIVAGVDVGGTTKGFHVVALRNGRFMDRSHCSTALEASNRCCDMRADIVAVDAPCRWSTTGRARPAERALAASRIFAYATPTLEAAEMKALYRWMLNGAALYRLLERGYTLLDGRQPTGPICLETFPHAAACALAGKILPAKHKCTNRRNVLRYAGIETAKLTNIDYVDAALCAVVAEYVRRGQFTKYGEATSGFIFVPSPQGNIGLQ